MWQQLLLPCALGFSRLALNHSHEHIIIYYDIVYSDPASLSDIRELISCCECERGYHLKVCILAPRERARGVWHNIVKHLKGKSLKVPRLWPMQWCGLIIYASSVIIHVYTCILYSLALTIILLCWVWPQPVLVMTLPGTHRCWFLYASQKLYTLSICSTCYCIAASNDNYYYDYAGMLHLVL